MAIRLGDYRTKGGRRAVVLCTDAPGDACVVGYVVGEVDGISYNVARNWRLDGRQYLSIENGDDLIVSSLSELTSKTEDDEVSA